MAIDGEYHLYSSNSDLTMQFNTAVSTYCVLEIILNAGKSKI